MLSFPEYCPICRNIVTDMANHRHDEQRGPVTGTRGYDFASSAVQHVSIARSTPLDRRPIATLPYTQPYTQGAAAFTITQAPMPTVQPPFSSTHMQYHQQTQPPQPQQSPISTTPLPRTVAEMIQMLEAQTLSQQSSAQTANVAQTTPLVSPQPTVQTQVQTPMPVTPQPLAYTPTTGDQPPPYRELPTEQEERARIQAMNLARQHTLQALQHRNILPPSYTPEDTPSSQQLPYPTPQATVLQPTGVQASFFQHQMPPYQETQQTPYGRMSRPHQAFNPSLTANYRTLLEARIRDINNSRPLDNDIPKALEHNEEARMRSSAFTRELGKHTNQQQYIDLRNLNSLLRRFEHQLKSIREGSDTLRPLVPRDNVSDAMYEIKVLFGLELMNHALLALSRLKYQISLMDTSTASQLPSLRKLYKQITDMFNMNMAPQSTARTMTLNELATTQSFAPLNLIFRQHNRHHRNVTGERVTEWFMCLRKFYLQLSLFQCLFTQVQNEKCG